MKSYDLTQRSPNTDRGTVIQTDRAGAGTSTPSKGYSILSETLTSILATVVLGLIVSGLYPLAVWGLGPGLVPPQSERQPDRRR